MPSPRCQVAKPTVYAHFKSKDSLIGTMLTAACEEWFTELDLELNDVAVTHWLNCWLRSTCWRRTCRIRATTVAFW